jgi:nucleoside 2-deoxyribosyltransferase
MQKVYIAARFSRRHEANELAQRLKEKGYEITSRWVLPDSDHVKPVGMSEQAADCERRRFAMEDVEDVIACDWMISLMEEPRGNSRGGRHVEFGVALGLGKQLTIIGPQETVFHHLDDICQFDTVDDLFEQLKEESELMMDACS